MNVSAVRSLVHERARRVDPADRSALAYLYRAPGGIITIGPGNPHDAGIVIALVQRLHPRGLIRGDTQTRTLAITDEGRRVVECWVDEIVEDLSPRARERVLESLRWIGAPTIEVDEELQRHQLVDLRLGREIGFVNYTWRTEICMLVAEAISNGR